MIFLLVVYLFLCIDNWLSAVKNNMLFFFEYHYNFVKMT